jgi:hypothetical protein
MNDVAQEPVNDPRLGIGGNLPPEDIGDDPLFIQRLETRILHDHKPLFDREVELTIGQKKIPEVLDKATAERAVSWVAQCRHWIADTKKTHKTVKAPVLALSRWIDGYFLHRVQKFERDTVDPIEGRIRKYRQALADRQRAEEEARRRRAAEEAGRQAVEAARLAREAEAREAEGNRREAVRLQREADAHFSESEKQDIIAHMPDQPVHIHGEHGATAFAVKRWVFFVSDPDALPAQYWMPDETAIREAMNAAVARGETPTIPGVTFSVEEETRIRRC